MALKNYNNSKTPYLVTRLKSWQWTNPILSSFTARLPRTNGFYSYKWTTITMAAIRMGDFCHDLTSAMTAIMGTIQRT